MRFTSLFVIAIILVVVPIEPRAQSAPYVAATIPPSIFFSDLDSGPNRGGHKNHGAWVTIWGKGLGASRRAWSMLTKDLTL
jgi:hypothetical protein